jgi:predicted nucleotidyltransferase
MGNERKRCWVLNPVDRDKALEVAEALSHLELDSQNCGTFVVRADVVEGPLPYTIVTVVEAENSDALTELVDRIKEVAGEAVVMEVTKHNPWPPHLSKGCVTEEEAAATNPHTGPGPRGNNPWG